MLLHKLQNCLKIIAWVFSLAQKGDDDVIIIIMTAWMMITTMHAHSIRFTIIANNWEIYKINFSWHEEMQCCVVHVCTIDEVYKCLEVINEQLKW